MKLTSSNYKINTHTHTPLSDTPEVDFPEVSDKAAPLYHILNSSNWNVFVGLTILTSPISFWGDNQQKQEMNCSHVEGHGFVSAQVVTMQSLHYIEVMSF